MDPDALLSELRLLVEALRSHIRGDPCPVLGVSALERQRTALDTLERVGELVEALALAQEPISGEEARERFKLQGIG